MKRILILYATREGQTAKVAAKIAERLEGTGAGISLVNAADEAALGGIDVDEYDLLVFGASMHAGGVEDELVRYLNDHKTQIERKPRSFFLVLLSAATRDPERKRRWLADATAKVERQLEVEFDEIEMIAGALAYSKYSAPLKWLMRRIARQAGEGTDVSRDYEYTDWSQVTDYADRLAAR